jgi:hypothetical protein
MRTSPAVVVMGAIATAQVAIQLALAFGVSITEAQNGVITATVATVGVFALLLLGDSKGDSK